MRAATVEQELDDVKGIISNGDRQRCYSQSATSIWVGSARKEPFGIVFISCGDADDLSARCIAPNRSRSRHLREPRRLQSTQFGVDVPTMVQKELDNCIAPALGCPCYMAVIEGPYIRQKNFCNHSVIPLYSLAPTRRPEYIFVNPLRLGQI